MVIAHPLKAYPLREERKENKMKTPEQIIEFLENEIEWCRMCAQSYLAEYMKDDEAFFSQNKCLEYHNSYLAQTLKLQQVLNFIKGDGTK